jgi:hypothetical protein
VFDQTQKRLLSYVFRILLLANVAKGNAKHSRLKPRCQFLKGRKVPCSRLINQVLISASCRCLKTFHQPAVRINPKFSSSAENDSTKSRGCRLPVRERVLAGRDLGAVWMLRNIADTKPYSHDGSVSELKEAIRIMAGVQLRNRLAEDEAESIEWFLKSLSGDVPRNYRPPSP